ncbi:DNA primase [Dechloromonas sp. TW-R-39-2]|uniref:hypothetical protein n=1 Tax=Dechloromonas sp. TW-R-39-2 TaxID=2654218 RepID=UPI00193D71E8|nr:hypothetical protein [Dechloromonas sp. TW-R-39-2]QRM20668.1 DNA primase [Dechloromonas sp. TW-R-39-2]
MIADNLISKLDKVRRTGPGKWQACCPSHEDRGPSLSIAEGDDGRVLVHCFAGCSVHEIVAAVGMDIADLFPPRESTGKSQRRPFPAADVLRAIGHEALVVAAAARIIANDGQLSSCDLVRVIEAASRIQAGVTAAGLHHA